MKRAHRTKGHLSVVLAALCGLSFVLCLYAFSHYRQAVHNASRVSNELERVREIGLQLIEAQAKTSPFHFRSAPERDLVYKVSSATGIPSDSIMSVNSSVRGPFAGGVTLYNSVATLKGLSLNQLTRFAAECENFDRSVILTELTLRASTKNATWDADVEIVQLIRK